MDNQSKIDAFNQLSIHNRIDPFFIEDIESYYEHPNEFSLSLKCSKSELSLYGASHVSIRQAFFNELPIERRVSLCVSKLKAANILDWVLETLSISVSDIVDAVDVGKGRSIYKLITNNMAYIIKEKTNNNQFIFNQIATAFNVPSPKSYFRQNHEKFWELTEFLNEHEVFNSKKDVLIEMYAKAAAFGDFLEVGDRHFENYISRGNTIIAIDVAHLMEKDNQHWTKKYIAGGLYEICLLQYYMNDRLSFSSAIEAFFSAYQWHANALFDAKQTIKKTIPFINALNEHWVSSKQFIQHMTDIYMPALNDMLGRICYKSLLQELVIKKVDLESYPELKMYYLADSHRISTFFRVDELSVNVFEQIQALSLTHLGITPQYFKDHDQKLKQLKDCLMVKDNHRIAKC